MLHDECSRERIRQVRKIELFHGPDWREKFPGQSIWSVYKHVTGDDREIVFARISPYAKHLLHDLASDWNCTIADAIENLIVDQFD